MLNYSTLDIPHLWYRISNFLDLNLTPRRTYVGKSTRAYVLFIVVYLFLAHHQHSLPNHSSTSQVSSQPPPAPQPQVQAQVPPFFSSPSPASVSAPVPVPIQVQDNRNVPDALTSPLSDTTPSVVSHHHQNGITSATNAQNNQKLPTTSHNFPGTGAQGTWKGSNTLTYTQSMQPPDNRSHHTAYCKLIVFIIIRFNIRAYLN